MEDNQEKYTDDLIKKLIREKGYEQPSEQFTDAVMQQLEKEVLTESVRYKTLIPKQIWILIGIGLAIVCWTLLSWERDPGLRSKLFPYADRLYELEVIQRISTINWNYFDNINIHTTVVYALLMLSFFLYLQFFLLRKKLF